MVLTTRVKEMCFCGKHLLPAANQFLGWHSYMNCIYCWTGCVIVSYGVLYKYVKEFSFVETQWRRTGLNNISWVQKTFTTRIIGVVDKTILPSFIFKRKRVRTRRSCVMSEITCPWCPIWLPQHKTKQHHFPKNVFWQGWTCVTQNIHFRCTTSCHLYPLRQNANGTDLRCVWYNEKNV